MQLSRHSPRLLEGGPNRPPFCAFPPVGRTILTSDDSDAPQHHIGLEARIQAAIELTVTHMGYEIVRVSVLGRDQPTVQVMADRADGSLIGIDDCQVISETVSAALDVADVIKTRWTLEVSSAGIDRPLTRVKDWNRFAGHQAWAEVNMPVNGRKRFTGIVLGADATTARMRLDDGTDIDLPLADLRRAKLLLTDALIAATAHLKKPAPGDEALDTTLN